jgi:hypothetical protein
LKNKVGGSKKEEIKERGFQQEETYQIRYQGNPIDNKGAM